MVERETHSSDSDLFINFLPGKVLFILLCGILIQVLSACQFSQTISHLVAIATPTATITLTATRMATMTPTFTATATATMTATLTLTATTTPTRSPVPTLRPSTTTASENGGSDSCNGGNTAIEAAVRGLINSERANVGVAALSSNSALTSAARAHSRDMATNNFFSHTGSDGSDPFARMSSAGYSYSAAAENLYAGGGSNNSAYAAVSSWMGSSGHRENMLNSTYTNIGVGYWCNSNSTYDGYYTADFGRP